MAFNSRQYEWADVTLFLGGVDLTGIRAIEYKEKMDKEAIYAKGRKPIAIQKGNQMYEGSITLLQSEYEALVTAGKGSILGLSLDAECSYGNGVDPSITDRIIGLQFTEAPKNFKQGDKFMEIALPFIALDLENQV